MIAPARPRRAPRLSIALISAAGLAQEVLLTRLLAIVQWHYLAAMLISLALLGYGAAGSLLAVARGPLLRAFPVVYPGCLLAFALSAPVCFLLAQGIAVNPEQLLWEPAQILRLFAMFVLLSLPFVAVALGIGLALSSPGTRPSRVYAADLLGAGAGAIGITALLSVAFPEQLLRLVALLGMAAAAVAAFELGWRPRAAAALAAFAVLAFALPAASLQLRISPYKPLSQSLRVPDTRVIERRPSPLGVLDVLASPEVPLRHVPGLSLRARGEPPAQLGVFTDADAMTAITRYDGDPSVLGYLDQTTTAAAYHLARPETTMVLDAAAGAGVLRARFHVYMQDLDAWTIDAAELHPRLVALLSREQAEFTGGLFTSPGVRLHTAQGRGWLAGSDASFDVIELERLDGPASRATGSDYALTVEALQSYIAHLRPGGFLAITTWVGLPPRELVKVFATAVQALERMGEPDPGSRIAMLRGWQTGTVLVSERRIGLREAEALEAFCAARAFDVAWYPGMPAAHANRRNRLARPLYHEAAVALLGAQREEFLDAYKFDLRPATDDRPAFAHFFRWRTLPEILALRGAGLPLLDPGYLLLVATLAVATVASGLLILLPLLLRWRAWQRTAVPRWRVVAYFFGLGVGFLALEIAFIQKLELFLHHPVYAVSVVLGGFLVFAGLGSAAAPVLGRRLGGRLVTLCVLGIVALGAIYMFVLDDVLRAFLTAPLALKLVVSVLVTAPLAWLLGMPFPTGIAILHGDAPKLVPWAWGINGCASVLSALGSALIVVQSGFTVLISAALASYLLAALAAPAGQAPSRAAAAEA